MGILRVYLAICVIAAHADRVVPWRIHDGTQAVQIFFIISGFYMAMVLSSRYATPRAFYASRILRIFPTYLITLAATIVLCSATGLLLNRWLLLEPYVTHPLERNGLTGFLFATLSNLTLIGQDWILFFKHDAGLPLESSGSWRHDANPLMRFLLVPQCWSVGLELTFYALAPLLNKLRSGWLVLIALVALAARLVSYLGLGLANDPWNCRFFPFEISLFLLGMLGYRLYVWTARYHPAERFRCESAKAYAYCGASLLGLLCVHAWLVSCVNRVVAPELGNLITYPFWGVGIPVLFFVFGAQKSDRALGELSYPIYLIHFLIIGLTRLLLAGVGFKHGLGVFSAAISVVVAVLFYRKLIAPMEKKRQAFNKTRQPNPA